MYSNVDIALLQNCSYVRYLDGDCFNIYKINFSTCYAFVKYIVDRYYFILALSFYSLKSYKLPIMSYLLSAGNIPNIG